jgi:hypothetical protein
MSLFLPQQTLEFDYTIQRPALDLLFQNPRRCLCGGSDLVFIVLVLGSGHGSQGLHEAGEKVLPKVFNALLLRVKRRRQCLGVAKVGQVMLCLSRPHVARTLHKSSQSFLTLEGQIVPVEVAQRLACLPPQLFQQLHCG